MSENSSEILKIQEVFKLKLIKQMENQNKRYLNALKIIEKLVEENETLKLTKKNSRRTKKKSQKKKIKSSSKENSSKNDFFENIKIINLFKKYDSALDNIIDVIKIIDKKSYLEKIQTFISKKEIQDKTILMESIQIIQDYINSNMNIMNGVLVEVNHKPIFDIFNDILLSRKMEENLEELRELSQQITSIKLNKNNSFKVENIEILRNELETNSKRLNVKMDIFTLRFTYTNELGKKKIITFNQLLEKIKDCNNFIEKENLFM